MSALEGRGDRFGSFGELCDQEVEGLDYRICLHHGGTGTAILAFHGGEIEAGTSEVALALAEAAGHSFYAFEGVKAHGNRFLHITSTRFDEPRALALVGSAHRAVAIHGCTGDEASICLGGLDEPLRLAMAQALERSGFHLSSRRGLHGMHPCNLCNRTRSGAGVQLELSTGLRQELFKDLTRSGRLYPTERFHQLIASLHPLLPHKDDHAA